MVIKVAKIVKYIRILCHEIYNFYFSKRVYSFFCVFIFLMHFYIKPVKDFSVDVNYPVTLWGIVFLFSNVYFDVVFFMGAIYLYAKVPFMERQQMYAFIRLGKYKWISVQILKMFVSAFLYVATVFIASMLLIIPRIELDMGWGKLYYTLASTDALDKTDIIFDISYNLINRYEPIALMLLSYVLISLIVFLIGIVMLLVSMCVSRILSIIISSSFAIMPILIENLGVGLQQIAVKTIPTEWIKLYKIGERTFTGVFSPDFNQIMIRITGMILVLVIAVAVMGNYISYDWYGED